jgi:4-hydroxy-tetrahydrodipicolinate synthase
MVTPFTDSGEIDIPAAKRATEHIVAGGASAFVLGTTGEAASVPQEGRPAFVEAAVKQTAGRTLTYAGIASNCFKTSVDAANRYFDLGVDAVVANLPSYYPITADHMLKVSRKHLRAPNRLQHHDNDAHVDSLGRGREAQPSREYRRA